MTQTHTSESLSAATARDPPSRRVFHLLCGACGGCVVVESDSRERHVRCPHCAHRVKVVRSAPHTCAYCGADSSADLTAGSTVGACEQCRRPYLVGAVPAPVARKHKHSHHPRPHAGRTISTVSGIRVIVVSALVLLGILAMLLLTVS